MDEMKQLPHTHTHTTQRERENRYCLMQVRAIYFSSNLAICKGASTSKVFMPQKVAATISVCQSCQLRATRTLISSASDERRICRRLPLWVLATKASPKEQCQRHKPSQAPLCVRVCVYVCVCTQVQLHMQAKKLSTENLLWALWK